MPHHSDSIGVFGEFGWERLGRGNRSLPMYRTDSFSYLTTT
jgi:hypothetical protein